MNNWFWSLRSCNRYHRWFIIKGQSYTETIHPWWCAFGILWVKYRNSVQYWHVIAIVLLIIVVNANIGCMQQEHDDDPNNNGGDKVYERLAYIQKLMCPTGSMSRFFHWAGAGMAIACGMLVIVHVMFCQKQKQAHEESKTQKSQWIINTKRDEYNGIY